MWGEEAPTPGCGSEGGMDWVWRNLEAPLIPPCHEQGELSLPGGMSGDEPGAHCWGWSLELIAGAGAHFWSSFLGSGAHS